MEIITKQQTWSKEWLYNFWPTRRWIRPKCCPIFYHSKKSVENESRDCLSRPNVINANVEIVRNPLKENQRITPHGASILRFESFSGLVMWSVWTTEEFQATWKVNDYLWKLETDGRSQIISCLVSKIVRRGHPTEKCRDGDLKRLRTNIGLSRHRKRCRFHVSSSEGTIFKSGEEEQPRSTSGGQGAVISREDNSFFPSTRRSSHRGTLLLAFRWKKEDKIGKMSHPSSWQR